MALRTSTVIVEFQPNIYIVNENDGMVSLTIVKRTPTTKDITVYLSTFNGSAIGEFYLIMNSLTVLIILFMQLLPTIFQL